MIKKKIAVICSSRATYGYKRKIISLIRKSSKLELQCIVTGMHLLKEYGLSVKEIEADGIPIAARVDMMIGGDTPASWAKSMGVEFQSLAQVYDMLKPDLVLVTGDRAEMFTACATAAYMNIPVAHIQAGDVSGHIDGSARHAMTKLSHIHFPSCEDSAKRVERLGEEKWRIFNVGAPQLDFIIHEPKFTKKQIEAKLKIKLDKPTALVIQHPILAENREAYRQMKDTLSAIEELSLQSLVIYPNVDAQGMEMIKAINEFKRLPFIHSFQNIERKIFISLLKSVDILIGNSSCGILEAPSFKLPTVNIGNRQRGRMQALNVINCENTKAKIVKAIKTGLNDKAYKKKLQNCVNPYGDGHSSEKIVTILEDIKINKKLLDKLITY